MNLRCLIHGGYGGGNAGDDLTLAVALRDMRARFGDGVAVLSPLPGVTRANFPGVPVIPFAPPPPPQSAKDKLINRLNWRRGRPSKPRPSAAGTASSADTAWGEALSRCELLYLAGGGYLTDLFELKLSLLPVLMAQVCGVPVETAPLGIGPFKNQRRAARFRETMRGVRLRVRDAESLALCRRLGLNAELLPDDGFRAAEVVEFEPAPANKTPLIGVNYFHQQGGAGAGREAAWWREMISLLHRQGAEVEGFCFHNVLPLDFAQTVDLFASAGREARQVRRPDWDFRAACRGLRRYDAIITARFHAAVVAGALGTPALAMANGPYYDVKMKAAAAGHHGTRVVDFTRATPAEALAHLNSGLAAARAVRRPAAPALAGARGVQTL